MSRKPLLQVVTASIAAFLVTLAMAGSAQAATGYVSGNVKFWNKNGNYCPNNANCTGQSYAQSEYNTAMPLSNAMVRIFDNAGTMLGQAATNTNGTYLISWTRNTRPSQIRLRFYSYHKDTRFWIAQTDGSLNNWATGLMNTASSSSASNPQNVGGFTIGSSASPSPYANAYWGAEREWRDVFNLVGVLQTNYTNVEIRGFADTIPNWLGFAPTSAAWGPTKRISLDANAGFAPQARVMHEMGHIATYVTKPWQLTSLYDWPTAMGGGTWNQSSAEWAMDAFEEAFATHYGSASLWWEDAVTPTTCLSSSTCYDSLTGTPITGTDIEATSFPYSVNNCDQSASNPEARRPISAMRFFWDINDSHNDADGDTFCAACGSFWTQFAVLAYYPNGTDANQIDEPWNAARTAVTEPDGRGSIAYTVNYNTNFSDVAVLRVDNCFPP